MSTGREAAFGQFPVVHSAFCLSCFLSVCLVACFVRVHGALPERFKLIISCQSIFLHLDKVLMSCFV